MPDTLTKFLAFSGAKGERTPAVDTNTREPAQAEKELLRLAPLWVDAAYETLRPYFLRYFPPISKPIAPTSGFFGLNSNTPMAAQKDQKGNNLLKISSEYFRQTRDSFLAGGVARDYACTHFLLSIAHELVHFSQPLNAPPLGANRPLLWLEGTAHVISWLILSEFCNDAGSKKRSRLPRKSLDDIERTMASKRVRADSAKVITQENYCFYRIARAASFQYRLPDFLPKPIKTLYAETVSSGSYPFQVYNGKEKIVFGLNDDPAVRRDAVLRAKGATVAIFLLQEKGIPIRNLIQIPISNRAMRGFFKEATELR